MGVLNMTAESPSPLQIGRLAPSLTGRMHLGNVYAALAAWLDARKVGGMLRLRIEDIDTYRVVSDADSWIMDDLDWLGMDWDGPAAYQSRRLTSYDAMFRWFMTQHLPSGEPLLYPCFCSRADIRAASAPNEGDGFSRYPGTCRQIGDAERRRRLDAGDRHSWRIAVPRSDDDSDDLVRFHDEIFGPQAFSLSRQLGDVIIRRSDGVYAYQFATAVDDWSMGVSRIVRGRDLLRSTAIQLWIQRHCQESGQSHDAAWRNKTMGAIRRQPFFAHLPLIDGSDGRRMAKRFNSLDMGALRASGTRPQEVIGRCAWLLGVLPEATPVEAKDLIGAFSFAALHEDREDRILDAEM